MRDPADTAGAPDPAEGGENGRGAHLASDDGNVRQRVPEGVEGALLVVVAKRRASALQLIDE